MSSGGCKADAGDIAKRTRCAPPAGLHGACCICLDQRVPRKINDKVDRVALPHPTAADYARLVPAEALRDDLEQSIAQIFSDVLNTTVTARKSEFLPASAVTRFWRCSVVIRCQERLNVDLSMSSIFDNPTVAATCGARAERKKFGTSCKPSPLTSPRDQAHTLSPQQYALWLDLKDTPGREHLQRSHSFPRQRTPRAGTAGSSTSSGSHRHTRYSAPGLLRSMTSLGSSLTVRPRRSSLNSRREMPSDETDRKLTEATHRPFSLHEGPALEGHAVQRVYGRSVLLLVVHHIILDAASETDIGRGSDRQL